jgi:hypothetical protein
MDFDHLVNEGRAVDYLASRLTEGTLVLFIGAGVSVGSGLPDWPTLITRLADRAGLIAAGTTVTGDAERLQRMADRVKREFCRNDERAFAELVRECLYKDVPLSTALIRTDLLIALGALMMGSKRGSVRRVVTYNFDGTLEWYLHLHGFVPRVVLHPPQLEGSEDVRLYHPHGYLPHPEVGGDASNFVLLGLEAANLRLGTPGEPWFELVRHLLRTGVGLVVGMSLRSFRDRSIAPLLASVGSDLDGARPTAFWLLRPSEIDDTLPETTREMLGSKVVPLWYTDFDSVPSLLLSICQQAASAIGAVRTV